VEWSQFVKKICSEDRSVWDPQTCQCGNHDETCEPGEQLYLDIFGQGVCGCKPGFYVWTEDGSCYQDGDIGPCEANQAFSVDSKSGTTSCQERIDEENLTSTPSTSRVFDVIPSGSNVISNTNSMVKVSNQNCVLDARGKCRRKLNLKRLSVNNGQEFKIWLESFRVRAPSTFNCTSSSS